jgi:hypothetical protein
MELQTAIEILEYHQEWRLGKREDMIHEPKKLTEALDIVLSEVKKFRLGAVSGQSEQLVNFLLYLNDKELINNHDFDYEKEAKKYLKKNN